VVDIETGEVRKDRVTGQTVFVVGICAMRGRDSSVIQVSVVGAPRGLRLGWPVRVVDLEAVPWERDGRSGVAWRAASIEAQQAAVPTSTTGAAANPSAVGTGATATGSGSSSGSGAAGSSGSSSSVFGRKGGEAL
jgi:hypothetical protein